MSDSTKQTSPVPNFQDVVVDQQGFLSTIEDSLEYLSPRDITKETRLELKKYLSDLKYRRTSDRVVKWTAEHQQEFFRRIVSECTNVGELYSQEIRSRLTVMIRDELDREFVPSTHAGNTDQEWHDATRREHEGLSQFLSNSFLLDERMQLYPNELQLVLHEEETVGHALDRLRKYQGKYDSVVLVTGTNAYLGIISQHALENALDQKAPLRTLPRNPEAFAYYSHSAEESYDIMQMNHANILPVIDSGTRILQGILTNADLERKHFQYHQTVSLSHLSLDYLKGMYEQKASNA